MPRPELEAETTKEHWLLARFLQLGQLPFLHSLGNLPRHGTTHGGLGLLTSIKEKKNIPQVCQSDTRRVKLTTKANRDRPLEPSKASLWVPSRNYKQREEENVCE